MGFQLGLRQKSLASIPFVRIALIVLVTVAACFARAEHTEAELKAAMKSALAELPTERFRNRLTAILALGNRIAGSEGERKTFDYCRQELSRFGYRFVANREFSVASPRTQFAELVVQSRRFPVSPLWPNLVAPSTCDVRGKLVDMGSNWWNEIAEPGSRPFIAVYTEPPGLDWHEAFHSGAKAVIFAPKRPWHRLEMERLFLNIPAELPRFWAPELAQSDFNGQTGTLHARQDWVKRSSFNLRMRLEGADPRLAREPVLLGAYAGAPSIVPDQNPGAASAANLAVLLDIAGRISNRKPSRPVEIVIFGAHALGLRGERAFVEERLRERGPAYRTCVFFDLSASRAAEVEGASGKHVSLEIADATLGIYAQGDFWDFRSEARDPVRRGAAIWRSHADWMAPEFKTEPSKLIHDGVNDSDGNPWQADQIAPIANSCEPFVLAGYPAYTFATAHDERTWVDTPYDTLDRLDLARIARQMRVAGALLELPLNSPTAEKFDGKTPFLVSPARPRRSSLVGGLCNLDGRLVTYDPFSSMLANEPVAGGIALVKGRKKTFSGVRGDLVEMSSDKASFRFDGIPLVTSYWHSKRPLTEIAGFRIDPQSGRIDLAATRGNAGGQFVRSLSMTTPHRSTPLVLFPARGTFIDHVEDSLTGAALTDLRVVLQSNGAEPGDFETFVPTQTAIESGDVPSAAVVFRKPDDEIIVEARGIGASLRGAFPIPKDAGPVLEKSLALDGGELNNRSIKLADGLLAQHVLDPKLAELATATRRLPFDALGARPKNLRLLPYFHSLQGDLVNGLMIFLLLLGPFAILFERVAFAQARIPQRILTVGAILAIGFVSLKLLHPAFDSIRSPLMVFVAFAMGALSLGVSGVIWGRFDASFRVTRSGRMKKPPIGVGSTLATANLRRRLLRTWLTAATIAMATFVLMAFSSVSSEFVVGASPLEGASSNGTLVRNGWYQPIGPAIADRLGSSGEFSRRVWLYPDERGIGYFRLSGLQGREKARALLGLDESDPLWSRIANQSQVILVNRIAISGAKVLPEDAKNWRDPDGGSPLPADLPLSGQTAGGSAQGYRRFVGLAPENVIVVPADTALALGGHVRALVNAETVQGAALRDLLFELDVPTAVSDGNRAFLATGVFGAKTEGTAFLLLPLILCAAFVFSAISAAVAERTKEIRILAALGAAPNQISAMFFAEAIALGLIGVVFGGFLALIVGKLAPSIPLLSGLTINFSSGGSTLAIGLILAIVCLAALYPARLAARLSAPAREAIGDMKIESEESATSELPFTLSPAESARFLAHLELSLYRSQSLGDPVLVASDIARDDSRITATLDLAPFEVGIRQTIEILVEPASMANLSVLRLKLGRLSGDVQSWKRSHVRIQEWIRSQVLEWRLEMPVSAEPS